jgi:hypothetical protein
MQNARVVRSQRLPLRFQRKAWEARQCVAGSASLQAACERAMLVAIKVKTKWQWRPQEVKDSRNVECPLRKAAGNK